MFRLLHTASILSLVAALGLVASSGACGGPGAEGTTSARNERERGDAPAKGKKRKPARSADAAYRLALDAEVDGDRKAANDYYRQALKIDATHLKANQHYVHFLIDNRREKKALQIAKAFFDAVPHEALVYHTLADAEAAAGEHEQVIGTMSGLLAFSESDASAFEKRGRARLTVGEQEDGIKDIRRAVEMEPDNPEFLVSLGAGLLRAGKGREARSSLIKALEVDDHNARAHLLLGIVARSEGRTEEAVEHHKAAVEFDPSDARSSYELGISFNVAGNNEDAEASLARAVDLDPESGTYWYGYGDLLRLLGRKEEAAAAYRQSVRIEPENARAWEKLGEVLIDSDELADAAKQLKRGFKKLKAPRLLFLLATVYAQANKSERAIEALDEYLAIADKGDGDRKAAEKLLKSLRR